MNPRSALTLAAAMTLACASAARAQMHAHVVNVGQGQSVLLEMAHDAVLIDAGGDPGTVVRRHLVAYLDTFFVRRPDLNRTLSAVIVTHPHIDHTRFLMDVMRGYTVRELVDGGRSRSASGYPQVRQARTWAAAHDVIYNKVPDARIGAGGYQPLMLRAIRTGSGVDVRFLNGSTRCENENNNSLAVLVRYRAFSMLVPGDAETDDATCTSAIDRMMTRFGTSLLNVDAYVADHHGSPNGETDAYLAALSPRISVISAGDSVDAPPLFNAMAYGHPREQAVAAIERATLDARTPPATAYTMDSVRAIRRSRAVAKAVYCTCWDGDLVIDVDSTGTVLAVRTSRAKP
ncbi:ComEC/Rec2 family competence protein [Longimicrobium sp.]|uniref:ComEC/Rec2 family competence protein n=1 Tax=Longimicrobium sp. TaxID=2029185 RepID=UPI002BC81850|nr:MBL fold metallo-hydrolase [Longimicrobium sp.]HSU13215.1 MBL fold metallo-hydrolase [Longimicrobium sp.]